MGPGRRKGPRLLPQEPVVLFAVVSGRFNQVELLASLVLRRIFPLFAGLFHRWPSGADASKTIVSTIAALFLLADSDDMFSVCVFIFSLVGIQRRISQGLKVLQYYTTKNWTFKNDKFLSMKNKLTPKDKELFYFSIEEVGNLKWDISKIQSLAMD